jgi:hypothetical protein
MRRAKGWLAVVALAALLAGAAGLALAAPPAGDLHHAAKALADDIKAQRHAQGLSDQARPTKKLGSSKTVRFKLPMKKGQGSDQTSVYCFGYTLDCTARVVGPNNTYSGKVTTSEGSQVNFAGKRAGQPLKLTLQTQFWGDTTFGVLMEANEKPWPSEAVVELVCSY